ncbi:serine hydrolase domain-containing protein [Brachybacterium sp. Z12]|uniref:serine hydrolase domain-containing protein n=1 Tax=Brachybacterium sp. Z12 TaxID=2759167 RepID=UPI00292A571A|nr:serine hydrolase domain-containing protein [Brachybacterium sp. Z12]
MGPRERLQAPCRTRRTDRRGPWPGRPRRARRAGGRDRAPPARPHRRLRLRRRRGGGGVGTRRIYSNTGFEVLAAHLEDATGYDYDDWMEQTVVQGLDLVDLEVAGSPAAGYRGSIRDLLAVGRELLAPTLIPEELWREATGVQFPGLAGILPGYGRQKPNDWGLGFEIRGQKDPHWTGANSSPQTFGHFGQAGSFLWVDPAAGLTAAFLGEKPFGPDHVKIWPGLTDAILERFADRGGTVR